jgi:hypothetical protein
MYKNAPAINNRTKPDKLMRAEAPTRSLAITALSLGAAALPFLSTQKVQAFPGDAVNTANSCRTCHGPPAGRIVSGLMDIVGPRTVDLIRELSGSVRGPLATWDAVAGTNVTVSVDIVSVAGLGANPRYSIQFKRLEFAGQKNSLTNFMDWSNANPPGSGWVPYGMTNTYFCKDLASGETGNFPFILGLGPSTPVDFYNLEFAVGGVDSIGLWYTDEHFYVAVVSPTLFTDDAVTFSAALANAGYILEVATDVNGPWTTYTGPTATIEGSNVVLMKTSQGPRKYFRLRKDP